MGGVVMYVAVSLVLIVRNLSLTAVFGWFTVRENRPSLPKVQERCSSLILS